MRKPSTEKLASALSTMGTDVRITGLDDVKPADAYRMVDFVKPVAMRNDRGMEVRVDRVRLGGSIDNQSTEKVTSIVLNGTWFDITTQDGTETRDARAYRVHVTNVVSAER